MSIDVIRLAREAGFRSGSIQLSVGDPIPFISPISATNCLVELERFADLVAAEVAEERAKARGTLMFNPYTGWARDPSDIRSDPHGILLLDPEQPIHAEAIRARKP